MARVRLDKPLEPGTSRMARLDSRVAARGPWGRPAGTAELQPDDGDRRWMDHRSVAREQAAHARWPRLARCPATRLEALVERRRHGVEVRLLPVLLGLPPAACAALLQQSTTLMPAGGLLVRASTGRPSRGGPGAAGGCIPCPGAARRRDFGRDASAFAPRSRTPSRRRHSPAAEAAGSLTVRGGVAALPAFRPVARVSEADRERLVAAVREGGLDGPHGAVELADRLGMRDAEAGLRAGSARGGHVVLVEPGRYLSAEALEGFASLVREVGSAGRDHARGRFGTGPGLSRKFLIPLLEWADRSGITRREGEGRRLRWPRPGAVARRLTPLARGPHVMQWQAACVQSFSRRA